MKNHLNFRQTRKKLAPFKQTKKKKKKNKKYLLSNTIFLFFTFSSEELTVRISSNETTSLYWKFSLKFTSRKSLELVENKVKLNKTVTGSVWELKLLKFKNYIVRGTICSTCNLIWLFDWNVLLLHCLLFTLFAFIPRFAFEKPVSVATNKKETTWEMFIERKKTFKYFWDRNDKRAICKSQNGNKRTRVAFDAAEKNIISNHSK